MKRNRKITVLGWALMVALFAGSIIVRRQAESIRGNQSTLDEVLYLPSGKTVKHMSLGYSNLLADIYWTRAVQYFGERHTQHSVRFELLDPLLEITTDLDPQLIVAYETGSIFLSQNQPDGAGQPDQAVALVEKGIRENPTYWRLYFSLGFIHYIDRHDYKAAQQAFLKGSEVPGALPFMKVMAARMAEISYDPATASYLWKTIYDTATDGTVKDTAMRHLISLRTESEMDELERLIHVYSVKFGRYPEEWSDMIRAHLIGSVPQDPNGKPYKLRLDGTVQVEDPKQFPYLERHAPR